MGSTIELGSNFQPYEHEICCAGGRHLPRGNCCIEAVVFALNEKVNKHLDREAFRREIIERFEEAGLVVHVVVQAVQDESGEVFADSEDPIFFTIVVDDRCDKKPFDYERQAHEVRNDILGLGTKGVIR